MTIYGTSTAGNSWWYAQPTFSALSETGASTSGPALQLGYTETDSNHYSRLYENGIIYIDT